MKRLIIILLFISVHTSYSQKQTTTSNQVWLGYLNQLRFSDKWGLLTEAHIRTKENFFTDLWASAFRVGAIYHATNQFNFTAGYAYFHYYPADNHKNISQPEHRPWQQISWTNPYTHFRIQQRIRLEERYRRKIKNDNELAEGYNFNFRPRYSLMMFVPLAKNQFAPKTVSFFLGDEVMLNFGKEITYNTFDQNRIMIGINYHMDADDQLQVGYMNIFQQQSSGNRYRNVHVVRIYYLHSIDFRTKNHHSDKKP